MSTAETALIGGPYERPAPRRGPWIFDLARGDLKVSGITDAPIPWPDTAGPAGGRSLVLCGDLIAAVRAESALAVQHHWGVSRATVCRWRKALEVPRFNPGTADLWRRQWPIRLGPKGSAAGGRATAGVPKTRAKQGGAVADAEKEKTP